MFGRRYLWNTLFFLVFFRAYAGEAIANGSDRIEDYQLVRSCQEEWLVYSAAYRNYVPYTKAIHESEPSVSILLNPVQDRYFHFLVKTDREAFLFIDGALQRTLLPGRWMSISCDSLYQKYAGAEIMLTVYGLRGMDGLVSFMGYSKTYAVTDSIQALSPSRVSLKPKSENAFRDFSVIVWLLILLVAAFVFLSVPSVAYQLASPLTFFSRDFRLELYHHYRAYSPAIVAAVIVQALITSFLLISIERHVVPVLPFGLDIAAGSSVWSLLAGYFKVALFCFLLYYFKYFVISVTLGILNMTELVHVHFIKAVQSSVLFYGLLSACMLVLILQMPVAVAELGSPLLWCVCGYYSTRYIVLYILLNQSGRIINLYLISYLCVVELIPLIIGIKYLM